MSIRRIGNFAISINKRDWDTLKRDIPILIANNSKNHFLNGFRRGAMAGGGFTDASRTGWLKRKKETKLSRRKSILVKTGHLRQFIMSQGILEKAWPRVVIGTRGIVYAARHNEGLAGMPKREFIGDSKILMLKNQILIKRRLDKLFKL